MNYLSVTQTAEKWDMSPRRVQVLCNEGRISGAQRVGNVWSIPENAEKPADARKKVANKTKRINENISIERVRAMPNKNTFDCTVEIKTHEGEIPNLKRDVDSKSQKANNNQFTQKDQRLLSTLNYLPKDFWDFKDSDVREYTHGIHNYPAMMVCPISRNIIRLVKEIQSIETIFDPFTGSGTVLVESMLAGVKNIYGNDINPLALYLSKVKTTRLDIILVQKEAQKLYNRVDGVYNKFALSINNVDEIMRCEYKLNLTAKDGWGGGMPLNICLNMYKKIT